MPGEGFCVVLDRCLPGGACGGAWVAHVDCGYGRGRAKWVRLGSMIIEVLGHACWWLAGYRFRKYYKADLRVAERQWCRSFMTRRAGDFLDATAKGRSVGGVARGVNLCRIRRTPGAPFFLFANGLGGGRADRGGRARGGGCCVVGRRGWREGSGGGRWAVVRREAGGGGGRQRGEDETRGRGARGGRGGVLGGRSGGWRMAAKRDRSWTAGADGTRADGRTAGGG